MELRLRPAVAIREQPLVRAVGLYLSLYDDEIEARADAFWSITGQGERSIPWHDLELTDAVFVVQSDGIVRVARGGACSFPLYWARTERGLRFSTALPIGAGEPLSRAGLIASAASAYLHSSYELNAVAATPLAAWRRVQRATAMRFQPGVAAGAEIIDPALEESPSSTPERIAQDLRAALDAYGRSQHAVECSVLELSGGFDSTLAAASIVPRRTMHGVSVVFPYYEFRFEAGIQHEVATALGIPRDEVDGTQHLPYAPSRDTVRFDEPTVFVTGIRHAESVARFAAERGAARLYTGHGGDQCFATDLLAREPAPRPGAKGPFSAVAWRSLRAAGDALRHSPLMERRLATFLVDARQDVWAKEVCGVTVRTPFSDLAVFRSAKAWSRWCRARDAQPDKTVVALAAADRLPPAVLERRGKVAYDGVWLRGYQHHADHIAGCFDATADVLEHLGISASWLIGRVRQLAHRRPCSDREVLAAYALSAWLRSWQIEHIGDVPWELS
jgi:asparagine synthetase B (glutamine-hydrolysing)